MSTNFPYFDIVLFALVAVFLILRLRSILGTRTGLEKPRDPFAPPPEAPEGKAANFGTGPMNGAARNEPELFPGYRRLRAAEPSFKPDEFLQGARGAFELIISAFAAGDIHALRPLLSDEVFQPFATAIQARDQAHETQETRLLSIKDTRILNAEVTGSTAFVTVKFVSDQINATRAADGRVVDGHAELVAEKTDTWTFSRPVRSADPNWLLVATRSD